MDELNTYLANHYQEYITGCTDCNLLVWGIDENDDQVPKLCTLIVGVEYDPNNVTQNEIVDKLNSKYLNDNHFKRMYKFGDEIASKGSVPYVVIGFPSFRNEYNGRWEETAESYPVALVHFYLQELPSKTGRLIKGLELRNYIYDILGKAYSDEGTTKAKNKSIADYFQFWSRRFLSRHLVKLDIDGMFYKGSRGVVVEIKRSNIPPIPAWRPYRNDYPDFALLKTFASSLNMEFVILHHSGGQQCDENTIISMFEVDRFISLSEGMTYSKQKLQMKLEGDHSLHTYLHTYL